VVGYYIYQRDEEEPRQIHYVKFNSLLMDKRQQRYSQLKRELCRLRCAFEQKVYLLRGCQDFIVETDAKYLAGMLNNLGKMPNAMINCWVDYIQTNFFFELVHKRGKTFGPDGLLRRKRYLGDSLPEPFKDGSEDGGGDITIRHGGPLEEKPLELEKFYNEIDSREGFYQESIDDDPLLTLWQSAAKDTRERKRSKVVFMETMDNNNKKPEQDDDSEELGDYNDNRCSDHAKKQEELINNIREFLTT